MYICTCTYSTVRHKWRPQSYVQTSYITVDAYHLSAAFEFLSAPTYGIKKHSARICTRIPTLRPAFCLEIRQANFVPSAFRCMTTDIFPCDDLWGSSTELTHRTTVLGDFANWCLIGDGKQIFVGASQPGNFFSKGPRPTFSLISLQSKTRRERWLCSVHRQGQRNPKIPFRFYWVPTTYICRCLTQTPLNGKKNEDERPICTIQVHGIDPPPKRKKNPLHPNAHVFGLLISGASKPHYLVYIYNTPCDCSPSYFFVCLLDPLIKRI